MPSNILRNVDRDTPEHTLHAMATIGRHTLRDPGEPSGIWDVHRGGPKAWAYKTKTGNAVVRLLDDTDTGKDVT